MAAPRDIGCEHPDLAVGDLARRAGVLPSHPAGRLALLQEPCLVHHQDSIWFGKHLNHVFAHDIAQRIGLPAAAPKDRLLPPGAWVTGRLGPPPPRSSPPPPGAFRKKTAPPMPLPVPV